MLQILLPFFPEEATLINRYLGVQKKGDTVFYFNGMMPIFQHHKDDYESFRLFTTQLIVNGNCKQVDIIKCFRVSPISVKRWVAKYRKQGAKGFYQKKKYLPANPH